MAEKFRLDPEKFWNPEELHALTAAISPHLPPNKMEALLQVASALKAEVPEVSVPEPLQPAIRLPMDDPRRSMWIIVGPGGEEKPEVCPTCGQPWPHGSGS